MSQTTRDTLEEALNTDLTENERHRLLKSTRRKYVIEILMDKSTEMTLDELAVELASQDPDTEVTDGEAVDLLTISLHHTHLPKLDHYGVIKYDPATRRITP